MTTHQEALEAGAEAYAKATARPAEKHGLSSAISAYLTTLAPADTITAQAAEIERLKEVAAFHEHNWLQERNLKLEMVDHAKTAEARLSALEALLDKAMEALGPFARLAEAEDFAGTPDDESVIVNVTRCRAARSTLAAIQEARHAGN